MTQREKRSEKDSGKGKAPEVGAKNVTREEREFLEEHAGELSKTTVKYAKWIHSTKERADRDGQSLATRSHEVIQHWAEERGARPMTVPGTEHGDRPGVLRFGFSGGPDKGGSRLQEISWDDFFRTFDERQLVFLYQERKADGNQSNFFRLDSPEREDA